MAKYYFTFGQGHAHRVNGKTFDCDSVVEIEAESLNDARDKMVAAFGDKWSHCYGEYQPTMNYFPRGIIPLEHNIDDALDRIDERNDRTDEAYKEFVKDKGLGPEDLERDCMPDSGGQG